MIALLPAALSFRFFAVSAGAGSAASLIFFHRNCWASFILRRTAALRFFRGFRIDDGLAGSELPPSSMSLLAEGDKVVVRGEFHGIHRGSFAGIEPTGKSVSASLIIIYAIANGHIVDHWCSIYSRCSSNSRALLLYRQLELDIVRLSRNSAFPVGCFTEPAPGSKGAHSVCPAWTAGREPILYF